MFKAKSEIRNRNILMAAMLVMLAFAQVFAVAHNFSHHSFAQIEIAKDQPLKQHNDANCNWCFLGNLGGQTVINAGFVFVAAFFFLAFYARFFDRIKASYLLSSKSSRAPPAHS